MKQRGFTRPAKLAVGDGALDFWSALSASLAQPVPRLGPRNVVPPSTTSTCPVM